jgi:hypothetical protein
MPFWNRTPKPSETSLLCLTITKLAAELSAQSEANRELAKHLLATISEKDQQIKLVLESKFEQRVVSYPVYTGIKREPEDLSSLSETEMSAESTQAAIDQDNERYETASKTLAEELSREFAELAKEHVEAHEAT